MKDYLAVVAGVLIGLALILGTPYLVSAQTFVVEDEHRCSPYDPKDYHYSPSVEPKIVKDFEEVTGYAGVYGPYEDRWFESIKETDIEHIVARSEAHDSGLCAASAEEKHRFAEDPLNLTLASPSVNRHQKVDKDPAEWLPEHNVCWYIARWVLVKDRYQLTMDENEYQTIRNVMSDCEHYEYEIGE